MRLFTLLLIAVALPAGPDAFGQSPQAPRDSSAGHAQAIAAIRKLGGEVTVGSKHSGAPVAVVLTGSASPGDCLPYLKEVKNLHACNL
jgi:hypothetical protein